MSTITSPPPSPVPTREAKLMSNNIIQRLIHHFISDGQERVFLGTIAYPNRATTPVTVCSDFRRTKQLIDKVMAHRFDLIPATNNSRIVKTSVTPTATGDAIIQAYLAHPHSPTPTL